MAPAWGFSNWQGREDGHRKGYPVVVTMESPNFSVVEIEGPDAAFRPVEKNRNKNAKQVTWVLLLKANRAVGCVAWLAGAMWALLGTVNKRLIFGEGVAVDNEREVYEQSIAAACRIDWPKDRLLIQVLDDSDDKNIQSLIKGVDFFFKNPLSFPLLLNAEMRGQKRPSEAFNGRKGVHALAPLPTHQ